MRPNNHTDFILSPITDILKDIVSASTGIGSGIETFPLCDYVMQSVFLKMTGFQEQKMKCVCWEMATVDYEYRYDFTRMPFGECSSYSEKQKIYKELIKQIEKYGLKFSNIDIDKKDILITTSSDILDTFSNTNLSIWAQKDILSFESILKDIKATHFANEKATLFANTSLKKMYEKHLYRQRNRIAHNTPSYQQNLPTLKTLANEDHKYENYFIYFFLLVLIDKVFIELYKKYLVTIDNN
ncbi:MAG: hypothetical protein WD048_03085 [Chitinophagales bacterium]